MALETKDINNASDMQNYVEGCLNDLAEGVSTVDETMSYMKDYTLRVIDIASASQNPTTPTSEVPVGSVVGSTDKLTESQIEHQIEMDDEEDSLWMDDDEEDEILGYECMGCGNLQNHESGFGCDVCTGHSLVAWYG